MADAFISYRRRPSGALAQLIQEKLKNRHSIDAYVDVTHTDSTRVQFPERLMQAIDAAPVFICLLGEGTLESEWVRREIQRAYEGGKHCVPVFQESYSALEESDAAVEYLLNFDGVHVFDVKSVFVDEAVAKIAALTRVPAPPRRRGWLVYAALLLVALLVVAGLVFLASRGPEERPDDGQGAAVIGQTPEENETPTDAFTPTLSSFEVLQTTEAELTQAAGTQAAFELTLTEQFISDSNATATAAQFAATETAAYATLLALSRTPTPRPTDMSTPTPTNTPDPLQAAFVPVTRNTDWTPVERDFDGVTMVLVPAGCFMMGSTQAEVEEQVAAGVSRDFANRQLPQHEQCFDQPFWIDKTEVTQAQFRRLGGRQASAPGFSGDERPVERITWFEARDFCELRDSRLPTEAEWEYAARGPDNLVYPWGNTWNASNAVWNRSSSQGTANVGSIPAGVSWVGVLDMSGNVWEWTSSLHESYPYDAADGREADTGSRTDVRRVLRGGSWGNVSSGDLRAPLRYRFNPGLRYSFGGFRCARSYE